MSTTPATDTSLSMRLLEADRVPDWLIRHRIRALVAGECLDVPGAG